MSPHSHHHFVARFGDLSTAGESWAAGAGSELDVFDLASLTKPMVTSSLLMMTCERSQWSFENFLEIRLSDWISELENTPLKHLKLRHLWEHRSGLPAHIEFDVTRQLAKTGLARAEIWQSILSRMNDEVTTRGLAEGSVYSDLGFLILGLGLERFYNRSLQELWSEWKSNHGLAESILPFMGPRFNDPKLVATETRYPLGEINDNNAYLLGGVAPHAGLAGSAQDVWRWLQAVQDWSKESPKIATWLTAPEGWNWRFYCGWDRPGDPATTLAGLGAPADTVGHLGYTGTALWWSPRSGRAGVLLSNRIYPQPSDENSEMMKIIRREFFSALWQGTLNTEWQIPTIKNGST